MNLFNEDVKNILPFDGEVHYYGKVMERSHASDLLERLLHKIEWKNDEAIIFGKHIVTKRKVAWYGDSGFSYTYSNTTRFALPWTQELLNLRKTCTELAGSTFNSCLLNLYHNGQEGVAWHSDDEKSLAKNAAIASLSFGAERKFCFKHKKTGEHISILLEHGSLLIMKGETQTNWLHSLPKSSMIKTPRVNLTFRTIVD